MKVVFLSRLFYPHVGGVEKHLYEISKELSKKHQITVITEQHDQQLPIHENTEIGDVYRIPVGDVAEKSKKWVIWKEMLNYIKQLKSADIVHIHDVFFWYLPFKLFLPNKKVFITFHGYEGVNPPGWRQIFWHKLAEKMTNGNICVAEYQAKWYHVKPTFVTYGGVRPISVLENHPKRGVIFIGRLSADASIMEYLEAVKQLKIPMDVYGDGPQRKLAENYVTKHHLPVNFLGYVSDASQYLPNYKISYVSRYLSILESLISGIPVIAHYNNNIKKDSLLMSKLRDFLYTAGTVEEIVALTRQILDNSTEVARKVDLGQKYAQTQTWPSVAKTYEDLWGT